MQKYVYTRAHTFTRRRDGRTVTKQKRRTLKKKSCEMKLCKEAVRRKLLYSVMKVKETWDTFCQERDSPRQDAWKAWGLSLPEWKRN